MEWKSALLICELLLYIGAVDHHHTDSLKGWSNIDVVEYESAPHGIRVLDTKQGTIQQGDPDGGQFFTSVSSPTDS